MPPKRASSPPSAISAERSKLNRNVSPSPSINIKNGVEEQLPQTKIYSPSNVTPSSNDVGKRTLFLNPFHKRDDDDSDTYSIPDEFTNIILNSFGSNSNQTAQVDVAIPEEKTNNKRELSRRTSRKQVNYNEQNSDDEEDEEKPKRGSKRKKKKIAKQENSDSEAMYVDDDEGGVPTCVRVSQLPKILERLMASIPPNVTLDSYGIQTMLLNCAMDTENFTSEEVLTNFCQNVINKHNEFRIRGLRSWQSDDLPNIEKTEEMKPEKDEEQDEEENE